MCKLEREKRMLSAAANVLHDPDTKACIPRESDCHIGVILECVADAQARESRITAAASVAASNQIASQRQGLR